MDESGTVDSCEDNEGEGGRERDGEVDGDGGAGMLVW